MPFLPPAMPTDAPPETHSAFEFTRHRPHLLAVAYRFLGSVTEAEDVVQDTYLRWAAADRSTVDEPRAFLTRIAARLALDHLKSARVRRVRYVGPWLPEPLVATDASSYDADPAARADLSHALLLALERLSPLERAAFVLHDLFDQDFDEIASTLQRTPAACRQLAARARRHVRNERPRFAVSPREAARVVEAFLHAIQSGDLAGLTHLLAADAVLLSDSGGKIRAARREVLGADRIARLFASLTRRLGPPQAAVAASINGDPGLLMRDARGALQTLAFEMRNGAIVRLFLMRNPEKLQHLRPPGPYAISASSCALA
jgi:RNA polymerase sigma-70 factor (ECF subfamily)